MSVKWTGKVWDLNLPHGEAWVLMAMVDHADHQGESIYPSVGLIAWKTGYSDRQVQRIIDRLISAGILVEDGKGSEGQAKYRADFRKAKRKPEYQGRKKLSRQRADKMSAPKGRQNVRPKTDRMSAHGQTFCRDGADISDSAHDKERARDLTVMEPSIKPSHTARGRARECVEQSAVENLSRHSFDVVLEYARLQPGIKHPLAVAERRFRDGHWNSAIDLWLAEKQSSEKAQTGEVILPGERDDELLESFLKAVETKMNRESFATWFGEVNQLSREGKTLHVSVPTSKTREWIVSHYADILSEALSEVGYGDWKIEFHQRE
jgi:hypothetical protein